jgi:hypothetical protein
MIRVIRGAQSSARSFLFVGRAGTALLAAATLVAAPRGSAAQVFTDPTGDFRAAYVAAGNPTTPDLDVTGGAVYFNGSSFLFTGTLAGAVPAGAPANQAYIYGINRGAGAPRFAGIGLPGILFDAVVVVRPNGPDVFNVCFPVACNAALPAAATFSGNTFQVLVPAALLPSTGFALTDYTFNLWPRLIGQNGGNADLEIPDFAPNNSNVALATVPEPATLLLLAPALAGLAVVRRRRAR